MSNDRRVELSWAGPVGTKNKKVFDYAKDYEVICRFEEVLSREGIYKLQRSAEGQLAFYKNSRNGSPTWRASKFHSKIKRTSFQVHKNPKRTGIGKNELETVIEVRIDFIRPAYPHNQSQ